MEVRKWMKHPVHSIKPLDSIQHARELMDGYHVNQLPVVVDGRLVGIITDRDLRDAFPSVFAAAPSRSQPAIGPTTDPRKVSVETVMTANATTVEPGHSMADAARVMRRQRIGALPVIEGRRVVGILTRSDVLDSFVELAEIADARVANDSAGSATAAPSAPRPSKAAGAPRRAASAQRAVLAPKK